MSEWLNWTELFLGRKAMTNLDSILKSRDITLPTKVHLVKVMVWKIDAFELWYWRRLLRIPWTARRSDQSILKEINPEYSLEGLVLKLRLQYFGHLLWRNDSLEKTLMLEKIEGRRRRGNRGWNIWMAWTWFWANSERQWRTGKSGITKCQAQLSNWTNTHIHTKLPLVANFYITWLLPQLPWSSFLRVTWDAVFWAWSPKYSHQIKHNSQLLGCDYFLSWHTE